MNKPDKLNKRGQVTIFIIIALVIVVAIVAFFVIRSSVSSVKISSSLEPVYASFLSCVEQDAVTGASILESQGGYIELPEFEAGSRYMPFSSQLNFLGNPIPYWYYVSGNNIEKEQVPSISFMEQQLGDFINSRIKNCEFQAYEDQGFEISLGVPDASVDVKDNVVDVNLNLDLTISKESESAFVQNHKVEINSNLGELYKSAVKVYQKEQKDLFLEEYGLDVLNLYAPVDGVEITCSPLVWNADNVFNDLQEAVEVNTLALNHPENDKYYSLDLPVSQKVNFINSQTWPSTLEVEPDQDGFLISNPIGNQQGLGVLGFCYAPYHFIYDLKYPVLVQVYNQENQDEIFQFSTAVIIDNNQARKSTLSSDAVAQPEVALCDYKNTPIYVSVKNTNLQPVDSQVSYECLGQKCNIGDTSSGFLNTEFPQCVNGYVIANAEGYETGKYLLSTVSPGSIEIILNKVYQKPVQLKLDGFDFNGNAIITFISEDNSKAVVYPEQKSVELSENVYDIEVQIYKKSDITLGATTTEQCVEVPRGNVLGALGFKQERCFDIEVPEQVVSDALIGGGKATDIYLSGESLSSSNTLEISLESFPEPNTLEQLQTNYVLFDNSNLNIQFT